MEKLAVLSDIHSNVYALEAVVADAKTRGVKTFINLGDILYGPIAPKATYDYLCNLNVLTISGNQDRQIYESTQAEIDSNPTMQFILNDLGKSPLEWMKQLPFDLQVSPDIYACHGTPTDDLMYLLENVSTGKAEVRADHEIVNLLNGVKSPIVLCGHTHTPRCVELSTGQLIINPGSVGLQAYTDEDPNVHSMQNYSSKASYVTLLKDSDNKWKVDFHRVTYDISRAVDAAKNQGREDWVHYLSTGRCL
ncbi:metallophosphoesterase family protein [Psychromonas sp.]|uniref:metallophosphoesterase family protein n=1 Tax=Psychromonas sp. TaxID=1884585 RepID=UPI003A97220B